MEDSHLSNETLTQPVRQTLYNSRSNQAQLDHIENMRFITKPRKSLPGQNSKRLPHTERTPSTLQAVDMYFNAEFVPRLPAKHLAAAPKFLFSLERKRLRIRNGISNKQTMGSDMQRTFFKAEKPRKSAKLVDRCKHTHEVHSAKTPQWCIVPPVIIKERAELPHFLFNMHHMNDKQYDFSIEEMQRKTAKGFNTSFYGCNSARSPQRQTAQSSRSALSVTRRSEYRDLLIE